jgi:hypothetical protein
VTGKPPTYRLGIQNMVWAVSVRLNSYIIQDFTRKKNSSFECFH